MTNRNTLALNNVTMRLIERADLPHCIPAIVNVFRDEQEVPWSKPVDCAAWVSRRVERGFYITAAYDGNNSEKMVGYSEWIETYDMGRKILYLGLMHVDCALRGRGIGSIMLVDGEAYAKSIGASYLRTMPEDERSHKFYSKYGFVVSDTIYACDCMIPSEASSQRLVHIRAADISCQSHAYVVTALL